MLTHSWIPLHRSRLTLVLGMEPSHCRRVARLRTAGLPVTWSSWQLRAPSHSDGRGLLCICRCQQACCADVTSRRRWESCTHEVMKHRALREMSRNRRVRLRLTKSAEGEFVIATLVIVAVMLL